MAERAGSRGTVPQAKCPPLNCTSHDTVSYPATSAQRRLLWRLLDCPEDDSNRLVMSFDVGIELDEKRLAHTLEILAQDHAVLRSRFELVGHQWWVREQDAAAITLGFTDLRNLSREEAIDEATNYFRNRIAHSINLVDGVLMAVQVFKMPAASVRVAVAVSHLVFDGYSRAKFIRDFVTVYASQTRQASDSTRTYGDHAWEEFNNRSDIASVMERQASAIVAGERYLRWPGGGELSATKDHPAEVVVRDFPVETVLQIADLCTEFNLSVFEAIFAAVSFAIARTCSAARPIIIVPNHGRSHANLDLVGLFVSHHPVMLDWSGRNTFATMLTAAASAVREANSNSHIPMQEILIPDGSTSETSMGSVQLNYRNGPQFTQSISSFGARIANLTVPTRAEIDLALLVEQHDDGFRILAKYDQSACNLPTVKSILEYTIQWLFAASSNPDRLCEPVWVT